MTESEWQELSDFLAQEVMRWYSWDELPSKAQTAFLALSDGCRATRFYYTSSLEMESAATWREVQLGRFRRQWWSLTGECPVIVMWVFDWKPHKDVAQAMLILKTLLHNIGKYAEAELHIRIQPDRCRVMIQNWVATEGTPAGWVRSPYVENEMQAICLAAKEWCNAFTE